MLAAIAPTVPAADRPIVVPIKIVGHYAMVAVNIGGNDVPLVLDTGNPGTLSLTQAALDRINAQPMSETSRGIDAQGNVLKFPKYKIPRVQLANATFSDVIGERDVHDPSYQADQVGQQGFLGTGLLKPYKVVIDYPHGTMTLLPPGAARGNLGGCRGTPVAFSPNWHGEPAAELRTDLGHLVVWWDTGTPALVLSKRFVQQAGTRQTENAVTTKRLMLGGVDFGPATFQVWDLALPPGFDGFIGYDFFATHVVCLDFPAKRLLIRH